jgi:hypothetical protein
MTQIVLKRKTTSKKIMEPKTIKNNGRGTAPGNLVLNILSYIDKYTPFVADKLVIRRPWLWTKINV